MQVEDRCLRKCLEVLANEAVSILHHVRGGQLWNRETRKVGRLQPHNEERTLACIPSGVKAMPDILD